MEDYEVRSEKVEDGLWRITTLESGEVLFEALWKTEGVTYNAYLVETSDGWVLVEGAPKEASESFLEEVSTIAEPGNLKYIILDHLEPDHSGALKRLLKEFPEAIVLISSTGSRLFKIPRSREVANGETLTIGEKSFRFFHVPWVHWPETMFTLFDGVLFTGDVLGSFGIHEKPEGKEYFYDLVKYTACVLMGYKPFLLRALKKIEEVAPGVVAPAHGPMLKGEEVREILKKLEKAIENPEDSVVLVTSMYGSSEVLASQLAEERGSRIIDVTKEAVSDVLASILMAKEIVAVFPTYENDVFPPMRYILELAAKKHLLEGKEILLVNTYLWGPAGDEMRKVVEAGKPAKVEVRRVKGMLA